MKGRKRMLLFFFVVNHLLKMETYFLYLFLENVIHV